MKDLDLGSRKDDGAMTSRSAPSTSRAPPKVGSFVSEAWLHERMCILGGKHRNTTVLLSGLELEDLAEGANQKYVLKARTWAVGE